MSKINISKIIEGVGICSENLIGISENLISVSEKISAISRAAAEIISEFQNESDKPAVGEKGRKTLPKQTEARTEDKPAESEKKEYTFTEIRSILAEKSRAGHTAEIKQILLKHGADKLSAIDASEYAAIAAEAEVLG